MLSSKKIITKYDYERIQNILASIDTDEYKQQIRKLKEKFKGAKLIDPKKIKSTIITMNTRFKLKNLDNGFKKECVLVFPEESDQKNNKISIFDEIGSELFAHEIGDVIHFNNKEDAYYLIEDILYQPEAAGDYNL
jgi:transcription elongation GreA/GreB family factor